MSASLHLCPGSCLRGQPLGKAAASPGTRLGRPARLPCRPCRAEEGADRSAQQPEASTTSPQAQVRPTVPPPRPTKLEKVERLGEEAWAGVAAVDRGDQSGTSSWGRTALLVAGDTAALLLFAAIGRSNHGEGLDLAGVATTAAPFIVGWFAVTDFLGGFSPAARGGEPGPAALAAAKCWAVGIPVALVLRSLTRGYAPDKAFVIVSLVATGVLLVGWRTALAALTPQQARTPAEELARRRDKRGNPLEFLQLLTSLTKRW